MSLSQLHATPGAPLSSVLRQDTTTQHKTLKTILKDVQTHNASLDKTKQMRIAKTIKQLNTDPTKVTSRGAKKMALTAIKQSGNLRGRFQKNIGAAIKEIDRQAGDMNKKSIAELRSMRPGELSKTERRRLKAFEHRMRARAAQAREEAEGSFHAGNHETTRFGLEQWQGASVSANSSQRRQSRYVLQEDESSSHSSHHDAPPPMVEMMLD